MERLFTKEYMPQAQGGVIVERRADGETFVPEREDLFVQERAEPYKAESTYADRECAPAHIVVSQKEEEQDLVFGKIWNVMAPIVGWIDEKIEPYIDRLPHRIALGFGVMSLGLVLTAIGVFTVHLGGLEITTIGAFIMFGVRPRCTFDKIIDFVENKIAGPFARLLGNVRSGFRRETYAY